MKIGVVNHPKIEIKEELNWIAQNGFDFVDLTIEPPKALYFDPMEIKKILQDLGLGVVGHTNPTVPAIYPVKSICDAAVAELKREVDLFSELGAKKVNIHPFYYFTHLLISEQLDSNIAVFKEMAEYAQKKNIKLMLENYVSQFDDPTVFARIFGMVPNLFLHLDIGHLNIGNDPVFLLQEFLKKFRKRLLHIHIHDNKGGGDEHLPLGCGDIDWRSIVKILKEFAYDGTITLEVFCGDRQFLLYSRDKLRELWDKV